MTSDGLIIKEQPKMRQSNIELFRILTMLLIVAHHFVVNSGILEQMYQAPLSAKSVFLFLLGAWGKVGINCFVIITGYFMCKSRITSRKFFKLFFEVLFYRICIYIIFIASGYEKFSISEALNAFLPVYSIGTNFTSCFLVFYLTIPFLNILIRNMTERQHVLLLILLGFLYVFLGTVPMFSVTMNYVSWFICLYMGAAYISMYPKQIYQKSILWALISLVLVLICAASVVFCLWRCSRSGSKNAYMFVTDSNTLLAVCLGFSSFLFFKSIMIKNSRLINTVAASTFGVLLIHANSDTMRNWLWGSVLKCKEMYSTRYYVLYAVLSVLAIYIICTVIDVIRDKVLEKPFLNLFTKLWDRLIHSFKKEKQK